MKYVLAPSNTFECFILPGEVFRFSDRCNTTAKRLTTEEALEYGVTKLKLVTPPPFNSLTQNRREIDPLLINGEWVQQWEVFLLDQEALALKVAEVQASIVNETQARLDAFAKTRNYGNILSAATYATSSISQFAAEGQYAVTARDQTWATLYTVMAEVQAGTRPMPSGYEDIELLLPVLTWPN